MKKAKAPRLDWKRISLLIKLSLEEDIGSGDATSMSVIPKNLTAEAVLVAREDCVCAGLPIAGAVFKAINKNVKLIPKVKEGQHCKRGTVMAVVKGNARSLLTAERTVLNFFQRLCGVATISAKFAAAAKGTKTEILDTRKTTPGWRNLEKYAVAVGGASNHRIGLYDRVMIKDNHRELAGLEGAGGLRRSIEKARKAYPKLEIEAEADRLEEVSEAADAGADYILLDNMSNEMMAKAIKINAGRAKLEASGGITLDRIPSIAKLGVDYISAGALTHSARAIDIAMDIFV
ncbi:MAG TPA: carboxylating nicotinate-nucleotide diphosphorylase [Lentisphaeria bacterium]|nr:MAG: nicotinate-nucleotide diphosphorylase (carboxylating) [Lentisphaerae bacterium GWF2_50_93]HCE44638.1 carboxylating nicotinate-nucleotide diphosphorylase [Lentisphaeria bacterium]